MTSDAVAEPVRPARRGWWVDAALAAAVATFLVLTTHHVPVPAGRRPVDSAGYVLLAVEGLSMAWLRRRPVVVLAVTAGVFTVFIARQYPHGPIWAMGLVALFALSWTTNRRTAFVGAAALCVDVAVTNAYAGEQLLLLPLFYVGWATAAVLLGDVLRNRRARLAQLQERARYLERSREVEARRRLAEERLRIARDLHDSVAHAMATINIQAGAAAHVVDRRPAAAKEALTAIQQASRDVLEELAAMLALLRDDDAAERAPTPGIGDVPRLVDDLNGAGLTVSLITDGCLDAVAVPVGTAVYRIVQESLTNVVRHANGTCADVVLRAADDGGLVVEIADDGTGPAPRSVGTGHGIRGMRERAEATGGRLVAGPCPDGGFRVRATWGAAS